MANKFWTVIINLLRKNPPSTEQRPPLSDAEKAVSRAEDKATNIATQVARMEGRLDPLRTFIEALEDGYDDKPRNRARQ